MDDGAVDRGTARGGGKLSEKTYPEIISETLEELAKWVREVTRTRLEDIGDQDALKNSIEQSVSDLTASIAAVAVPTKATGAEVDTGTDDVKYATSKALKDSHNVPTVAPGAAGNVMVSDGTDWQSTANAGRLVDRAYAENTGRTSLTTALPYDNTIPQVTEGDQILTCAITPKNTTNRVRVRVDVPIGNTTNAGVGAALFLNGAAAAVRAVGSFSYKNTGQAAQELTMTYEYVPASVSTQTFTVRAGADSGNAILNGSAAAGIFGGVSAATITIEEIRP